MTHSSLSGAATPRISIALACDGSPSTLPDRVAAIARACRGVACEVIVVHAADAPVTVPSDVGVPVRTVSAPSRLVPVLWGHGIAAAQGDIVALTTTQFRVREGWARALLERFEQNAPVGVGGLIEVAPHVGMLSRAVYLLRYSEHMPPAGTAADLPGENAAYRRAAVLSMGLDLSHGFWEVDFHRLVRSAGGALLQAPDAIVDFVPVLSLGGMLLNRFVHGSHFGAYRVRTLGWPRWKAVAVTPLVPAVLLARVLRRARDRGRAVSLVFSALPALLILLAAWALGEAVGAARLRAVGFDVG